MNDQVKETNKLYEAIEKMAVDKLSKSFSDASTNYRRSIGLSGTSMMFSVKPYDKYGRPIKDGQEVFVSFTNVIDQLEKRLVKKRKEAAIQRELDAFLKGHSEFHYQLNQIQSYVTGESQ